MLSQVISGAVLGVDAYLVRVEVDVVKGLPAMNVVGMAETAVREGRERVLAALNNAGVDLPPRRVTVNLSPADVSKSGSAFDLPIAFGLLAADGRIPMRMLESACAVGELGLDGTVRPVRGVLPIVDRCRAERIRTVFVPSANAAEAAVVEGIEVLPVSTLDSALMHMCGRQRILPVAVNTDEPRAAAPSPDLDYADVRGQPSAKRAIEIAAAGHHNILLVGPPGSGKSMLARRLPGILPPLSRAESIEVTKIYSIAGRLRSGESLITTRPFRAPHHTASDAALVGGGGLVRPGEVTLAHRGVLFLDELPEFRRNVLESLRQPIEDNAVTISRSRGAVTFPARFMLVAAMNPCPCGYHGTGSVPCICAAGQVQRYAARISGPLLDRIDLHVHVPAIPPGDLANTRPAETSSTIRERVMRARDAQRERFEGRGIAANAELGVREISRYCRIDASGEAVLKDAVRVLDLSARAYHRVLRVARTIADLDGEEAVRSHHVAEAVGFRVSGRG